MFAFEELSDGVASVPIEEVKAMYDEMKTVFDYVLVSDNPLAYRGYYEGDTSFVDGYERYQNADVDMKISNPVNVVSRDWEGNEFLTTPLKTVLLGESIFNRFKSSIEEGRNLQMSDFTLAAPNEPISVVLGNAFKDIYELGDIFSLELISEVMDFQVVGFYKSGVGFSMDVGALQHMNFDHTIVTSLCRILYLNTNLLASLNSIGVSSYFNCCSSSDCFSSKGGPANILTKAYTKAGIGSQNKF